MCQAQEQRPGEIGRTGRSGGMGNRESPCCKCTARGCQAGARQKGVGSKFPEASRQPPAAGLCSACWLARGRSFLALLGFHSNELKTLAR